LRDKRRALLKQWVNFQAEREKSPKDQHHTFEHANENIEKDPVVNSGFDALFEDIEKLTDNQIAFRQA
jgi:hypothetical protein